MNISLKSLSCFAALATFTVGCQSQTSPPPTEASANVEAQGQADAEPEQSEDGEAEIRLAMAELSDEDRKEAEAQKFCAIMKTSPLGSMGVPLKLDIKGQPVFVCCAGCKSKALKNPDDTLATVAKLKAENSVRKESAFLVAHAPQNACLLSS